MGLALIAVKTWHLDGQAAVMAFGSQELPRSCGSRSPEAKVRGKGLRIYALVSRVTSEPLLAGKKHM